MCSLFIINKSLCERHFLLDNNRFITEELTMEEGNRQRTKEALRAWIGCPKVLYEEPIASLNGRCVCMTRKRYSLYCSAYAVKPHSLYMYELQGRSQSHFKT